MIPIPNTADDITAEWLTAALAQGGAISSRVSEIEFTHFGKDIGLLSAMLRCRLRYDAPDGREPDSVVVKLEPTAGMGRELVERWHGFEHEIQFYREIAPVTPIRVPRFFFGGTDTHRGVVVMEDLGHLRTADQIQGLHNDDAVAAVRQIARLHARFWNSGALERLDWMPIDDPRLTAGYADGWDGFVDVYGSQIGDDAVALGRRLGESLDWLRAEMATRPRTICHGDFRADNMLFGDPEGPDAVVLIDWQVPTRSFGALDLARLVGGSEPPAERRAHHMECFEAWHESLREQGVKDYSADDALGDFRLGALLHLCTPVRIFGSGGYDWTGRRRQLLDTMATRFFASALEIEAGARFS